MERADLVSRAQEYANRKDLTLGQELGSGVQGIVFSAEYETEAGASALQVHKREAFSARALATVAMGDKINVGLSFSSSCALGENCPGEV